jgi:hypothetical protein
VQATINAKIWSERWNILTSGITRSMYLDPQGYGSKEFGGHKVYVEIVGACLA